MKTCTRCKIEREDNMFSLHRKRLRGICKPCTAAHKRNRLQMMKVGILPEVEEEKRIKNASNLWFGPVIRRTMIPSV